MPAADALNQAEPVQAVKICRVLERLGDGASAVGLAMAWVTASDKYKTLPTVYVTYLCFATNASQNAEARQRLQDWIATDLLATPEKVRTAAPANWGTITNALTASLSPEARAAWAAKLRGAYVDNADVLSALKLSEVRDLCSALGSLKDDKSQVPAKWVETSTIWQSLQPGEVSALAGEMGSMADAGAAARAKLADFVSSRYLSDAAAIKSVGAPAWNSMVSALGKDLSADAKASWAAKLRAAYVDDAAAFAALKAGEAQDVARALTSLGNAGSSTVLTAWVDKAMADPALTPADLKTLVAGLSGSGDAGKAARARLAEDLQAGQLADVKSIQALGAATAANVAWNLAGGLTPEAKTALAAKMRAAFVDDAAALAAMTLTDARDVGQALSALGDKQGNQVPAKWVEGSTAWQSLKPNEVSALVGEMGALADAGAAARAKLADFVSSRYLSDAAAIKSVGVPAWNYMVSSLGKDLSADAKAAWAAKLRAVYVDDAAVFGSLKVGEAQDVARVLTNLGDPQAPAVLAAWVDKALANPALTSADLKTIVAALSGSGDAGKAARARLTEGLKAGQWADAKSIQALGAATAANMAWNLAGSLTPEDKAALAAKMRAAFVDDAAVLGAMTAADARDIGRMLQALGDKQGNQVIAKWVEGSGAWQSLKPAELGSLCVELRPLADAGAAARAKVAAYVTDKVLTDAAAIRATGSGAWGNLASSLASDLNAEAKAGWIAKIRAAYVDDAAVFGGLKLTEVQDVGLRPGSPGRSPGRDRCGRMGRQNERLDDHEGRRPGVAGGEPVGLGPGGPGRQGAVGRLRPEEPPLGLRPDGAGRIAGLGGGGGQPETLGRGAAGLGRPRPGRVRRRIDATGRPRPR